MKTILYHHTDCSKSCEVLSILEEAHEDFTIIDYVNNPPSKETLNSLITQLGITPENLVRKNEPLFKQEFDNKHYTNEQWIEILATHPILIERPIVIKNGKALIGRPPKSILSIL
ncbi:MAG: arsenate reductase family protein [Bacteroidota bacterium]